MNNHTNPHSAPILLTIAGFDPSCGAGVAADLKTFAAHNCYGVAAVTALTVQSTQGVRAVHATPSGNPARATRSARRRRGDRGREDWNARESRQCLGWSPIFSMLTNSAHVVLDPVSRPTAGNAELLDAAGLKFVRDELLKRASVITPNMPEAEFLTGMEVKDLHGMKAAGKKLLEMGARAVIVTGGHLDKPSDVLCEGTEIEVFGRRPRQEPQYSRLGLHFFFGHCRATCRRAAVARGRDPRQGLRYQGHRKVLRDRQRRRPAQPAFPLPSGAAARGVHEVPQHGMHPAAEPTTH